MPPDAASPSVSSLPAGESAFASASSSADSTSVSLEGVWNLWLTEIPQYHGSEQRTLLPQGDAKWEVQLPAGGSSLRSFKWALDDDGCLLLTSQKGTLVSSCAAEISAELLTLTPAHGFRSLYERVAWEKAIQQMDARDGRTVGR